ncbi:MAG: LamG-like jellyroll fold domain-containing protein [Chthoniobacterales bacterium]
MKIKRSLLSALLALLSLNTCLAADPTLYFFFEDNADPAVPTNSGVAPFALSYLGDSHQSTAEAKFGKGSMLIGEKKGDLTILGQAFGLASKPSAFNGAIHKMTITAWVRAIENPESPKNCLSPGFNIMGRYSAHGPGPGSFMLSFAYDALQFDYYSEGSKKVESFRSLPIRYVEANVWTQMAVTFDEGKVVFYFNGIASGDADGTPLKATVISEATVGSLFAGFTNLRTGGYVDDVGVLIGRALTEEEIEKVYNTGLENFIKNSPGK